MTYNSNVLFEWDPVKSAINRTKHGLSFDDVTELFMSGDDYLEMYDEEHSAEEDRFVAVGLLHGQIVVVVFTERQEDVIRVLSARRATRREGRLFFRYIGGDDG